jgi:transcriptional regulator with XRE-family HTH domain
MRRFNQQVGSWLRRSRVAAGISVESAADTLGLGPTQMRQIEAGHRSLSGEEFSLLIAAYEVPYELVDELLAGSYQQSIGEPVKEDSSIAPVVALPPSGDVSRADTT